MQTKYNKLKRVIKKRINQGSWKVGEKILSERALSDDYNVSRITAKKAISDLITEGLLEHIPGRRGTFVCEMKVNKSEKKLIAAAFSDISDTFRSDILKGIEDCLWQRQYHTVFCNTNNNADKLEAYIHSLIENDVSGFILSPVICTDYLKSNMRIIDLLEKTECPYILVDRYIPSHFSSYIISNNIESSYNMTKKLTRFGHDRILVLKSFECSSTSDRTIGIKRALEEQDIAFDQRCVINVAKIETDLSEKSMQYTRLKKRILKAGDFTAVVILDSIPMNLVKKIFHDLNISGIDLVTFETKCLSEKNGINRYYSLRQPSYKMGFESARILTDILSHKESAATHVIMKSTIDEYEFDNFK